MHMSLITLTVCRTVCIRLEKDIAPHKISIDQLNMSLDKGKSKRA